MSGKKKKRSNVQVLEIVEGKDGKKHWHSEVVGWVPLEAIEMGVDNFSVGTKVTIEYSKETILPKSMEKN